MGGAVFPPSCLAWGRTVNPYLHRRLVDTHRQVWLSLLWGDTAPFSWLLVHAKFSLCSPRACFPSPVKVQQSNPTGALSQISWGFSVPLSDPQVRKPVVGPRAFLTVWDFFSIIVPQFVGRLLCSSMLDNAVWSRSPATRVPVPAAGHC